MPEIEGSRAMKTAGVGSGELRKFSLADACRRSFTGFGRDDAFGAAVGLFVPSRVVFPVRERSAIFVNSGFPVSSELNFARNDAEPDCFSFSVESDWVVADPVNGSTGVSGNSFQAVTAMAMAPVRIPRIKFGDFIGKRKQAPAGADACK
jgi:hypothetical protein